VFYFYIITNLINNKIYVGITNNTANRWNTHKRIAKGGKGLFPHHYQPVHQAISKYGVENFIFEISQIFEIEDEAYLAEEWWIGYLKYMRVPNYNIAGGGKGTGSGINHPMYGKQLPPEWKSKVIEANKINANLPAKRASSRQHMIGRNWRGENHPNFGKTTAPEVAEKISSKLLGRIFSDGHKTAISASLIGRELSDEHKKNISLSKIGKYVGTNNPNSKLSLKDIEIIYKMIDDGSSNKNIAKIFDVHHKTIQRYRKNRNNIQ
jgi:group I intron endonuclease